MLLKVMQAFTVAHQRYINKTVALTVNKCP